MYKQDKKDVAQSLRELVETKKCVLVLSHKKLTFVQIDKARRIAEKGTVIKKVKNRIAQKAFENSIYKEITKELKEENLFIFGEDLFETCKIAKALEKDVTNVQVLKAASNENSDHELSFVNELAMIGSKENLQSKLLSVINEVVCKTLRVIDARCEKLKG